MPCGFHAATSGRGSPFHSLGMRRLRCFLCHRAKIQLNERVICAISTGDGARPALADSGAGRTRGYPVLASCQECCSHCKRMTGVAVASIQQFLLSPHIKASATSCRCSGRAPNGCKTCAQPEERHLLSAVGRNQFNSRKSRLTSAPQSSRHGPRSPQVVATTCRFRTDAPVSAFEAIAGDYPVFRIDQAR